MFRQQKPSKALQPNLLLLLLLLCAGEKRNARDGGRLAFIPCIIPRITININIIYIFRPSRRVATESDFYSFRFPHLNLSRAFSFPFFLVSFVRA